MTADLLSGVYLLQLHVRVHIVAVPFGWLCEQIDFGKDLEQHLSILVDCRASFPNLDLVKDRLVLAALRLCAKTLKLVKGRHNKKTLGFVKGCFAFAHITIPSIDDVRARLTLFKLAGEVALMHLCLPQADTFFKAVIQEILEVPEMDGGLPGAVM